MADKRETPFDNIESAYEYVGLLCEAIEESKAAVIAEGTAARDDGRLKDALQLVEFKLAKLHEHARASHRLLNDLRTLRRLLLAERGVTLSDRGDAADAPDWDAG